MFGIPNVRNALGQRQMQRAGNVRVPLPAGQDVTTEFGRRGVWEGAQRAVLEL